MSSPFEQASAVERIEDNVYRSLVPSGWEMGRGAFGGLVLGTLARAMIASEPDAGRSLRFFAGEIAAPVPPGETRIEVEILRRGNNLTNLDARLRVDGSVLARASAGLSTSRSTAGATITPKPPGLPAFADTAPAGVPKSMAPPFSRHFDFRSTGPLPFSGGPEPIVEGYVRELVSPSVVDAPMILALLDSYWPATFSVASAPHAAATVGFTAQLLIDPSSLDPASPLSYRSSVAAMRDGFFVEMRELWNGDELVAMNQQTFAKLS